MYSRKDTSPNYIEFSKTYFDKRKFTQEKTLVPILLNSQKIKRELEDLCDSKNPTRGNFILNSAFNF